MEEYSIANHKSDAHMARSLMKALDYREKLSSEKKRYMLESWPENTKRHKKIGCLTVKYVPELALRDNKDITGIRTIVEGSITAFRNSSCNQECHFISLYSFYGLSSSEIPDMPDLDLVKMSSLLLPRLTVSSLKALSNTLKGNHIVCDQRQLIEYELRVELEKSMASFDMHSEQMLTMASILRNPSSYIPPYCLTNLHIKPFSSMPASILEAAWEAFKHIDQFPKSVIVEVSKLLISDSERLVGIKKDLQIVLNLVQNEIKSLLSSFEEGCSLPVIVENALHLLSFSARILYGDDGNLKELLKPLSSKQCVLENRYEAALSHLKDVQTVDLLRIFNAIGQPFKWKKACICELQRMLISSIHCIYDGAHIPDNISKVLSMINAAGENETNFTDYGAKESGLPHKGEQRIKLIQRIKEEVDAVLDVSSEFRNLIRESYAAFCEHDARSKLSNTIVKQTSYAGGSSSQGCGKDEECVHVREENIESTAVCKPQLSELPSLKNEGLCEEETVSYVRDVERFSDEVASATYILIGRILQEVSSRCSIPLRRGQVRYLLTGVQASSDQSNCDTSGTESITGPMLDRLVLETAKSLLIIPKSVQQKVEDRLGNIVEAGADTL